MAVIKPVQEQVGFSVSSVLFSCQTRNNIIYLATFASGKLLMDVAPSS